MSLKWTLGSPRESSLVSKADTRFSRSRESWSRFINHLHMNLIRLEHLRLNIDEAMGRFKVTFDPSFSLFDCEPRPDMWTSRRFQASPLSLGMAKTGERCVSYLGTLILIWWRASFTIAPTRPGVQQTYRPRTSLLRLLYNMGDTCAHSIYFRSSLILYELVLPFIASSSIWNTWWRWLFVPFNALAPAACTPQKQQESNKAQSSHCGSYLARCSCCPTSTD